MVETAKTLLSLSAADIMSHQVVMVPREMSLQGAARMLARAGVTGAPVVDERGRCIGVLSATDFMRWLKEDRPPGSAKDCMCKPWQIPEGALEMTGCVENCMTKDPVLVTPAVKLGELARMMMDAHIHRVVVVDSASNRPIGIVSTMDILAAIVRADQVYAEEDQAGHYGSGETL